MSQTSVKRFALAIAALLASAVVLTSCGGGDSSGSSSSSETSGAESSGGAETSAGSGGAETSAGSGGADVAAAKKIIAPYIDKPSPFPVTEPLKEVPKGATIAYMDCGTPICGFFYQLLSEATKTMGVKLERIKAGSAANTVQPAYETVVTKEPDAVISANIVELWQTQLKELQEAEIPVVTVGVTGTEQYGIKAPQAAENSSQLEGKLEANYILAEFGPESKVTYYDTPELGFTVAIEEALEAELGKICPDCSFRSTHIPAATFGNTAPNSVVSDLQANPETNVIVFGTNEVASGLPTALSAAGIDVKTLSQGPEPTALQYIKEGKQTAGLGVDFPILVWTLLDQAAREIVGQELTGPESEGLTDYQFLTKKDITFDPAEGWTGYADFPERFAKLWGVGG